MPTTGSRRETDVTTLVLGTEVKWNNELSGVGSEGGHFVRAGQETLLFQIDLTEDAKRDLEDNVTQIARHDSPESAEHAPGQIPDIVWSLAAAEEGRRG